MPRARRSPRAGAFVAVRDKRGVVAMSRDLVAHLGAPPAVSLRIDRDNRRLALLADPNGPLRLRPDAKSPGRAAADRRGASNDVSEQRETFADEAPD